MNRELIIDFVCSVIGLKKVGKLYSRGMYNDVVGVECEGVENCYVEVSENKSSWGVSISGKGAGKGCVRFNLKKDDLFLLNWSKNIK